MEEYLNFDIQIFSGENHKYPVRVLQSPAGEASTILNSSFNQPEFERNLRSIELFRGLSRGIRSGSQKEVNQSDLEISSEVVAAREVGGKLFEALFSSEILSLYRSSLDIVRAQSKKLRIRLRVDAGELAVLPWEFLYDRTQGDYVSLLRGIAVTRYLDLGRPVMPLQIQPPLRILGMVASPNDFLPLDIHAEQKRMRGAIEHLLESNDVELNWVKGQTWRDLEREIESSTCHIFHFIGHGAFITESGEAVIALVDEQTGSSYLLSATQLGRMFNDHPTVRLVVINACESARASEQDAFSSIGATIARRGIPAVISMQYAITDQAAIEFSRSFYDNLARGQSVDTALQAARRGINMALKDTVEWGTPVLNLRAKDSALFQLSHASVIFNQAIESAAPAPSLPRTQQMPLEKNIVLNEESLNGLKILVLKMRQYWIQGVLEQSLYRSVFIDLGMEKAQNAVESPWGDQTSLVMIEKADANSQLLEPHKKLSELFEEEGGSLLILGEPGSGKTTILLELARGLLDLSENDPIRPVPMVFNLSSWNPTFPSLTDWLVQELSRMYQVPQNRGRGLLASSRILPLLDGLDEVGMVNRSACVKAINRFTMEAGLVGAVVCCRLKEYIELTDRLNLNAAVRLLPLSDEQVFDYLDSAAPQLDGLRSLLQRDSSLRIDAHSPLMLGLLSRTYHGIPEDQLRAEKQETTAARRKQLMDAYMTRMFKQAAQRRGM